MLVFSHGNQFPLSILFIYKFPATTLLNCVSNVSFLLAGDEQHRVKLKLIEQHKLIGV